MEEQKKELPEPRQSIRPKSGLEKAKNSIVKESMSDVGSYILSDVLIPAAKKLVTDVVTNGIELLLYGETSKSKKSSGAPSVSYRNYYDDKKRERDDYRARDVRRSFLDYDITFRCKADAKATLDKMQQVLDSFPQVTVKDYVEIAQEVDDTIRLDTSWADDKYGWKDLRAAEVVYSRGDWIIDLPPAKPIV